MPTRFELVIKAKIDTALAHWAHVAPLHPPAKNKAQYQALVEALDAVLDAGGADESKPLARLAAMLGDLVSAFEETHHPMPAAMSALETLRWFIARDGLRQSDLPEIGNQAKVSEILSGRRAINLRQARALAARFGVPLELFAAEGNQDRQRAILGPSGKIDMPPAAAVRRRRSATQGRQRRAKPA